MKKVLFATTAAVAFTVAGAAQAQVELGLGGYWEEWVGFVNQDADEEDWDQQSDKEIHVKGSTTLDNGVTFGVRFEIEANDVDTGNKHDESVLTVSGGFGTLILGNEDNGANLLHVSAPDVGVGLQDGDVVGGKWVDLAGAGNAPGATAIYDNDDTNKITYVAPTFGGFTAGVSFIPDITGSQSDANVPADDQTVQAYGVGAQYANELNGASVKASFGYAWADEDGLAIDINGDGTVDLTELDANLLSVGLQVGFSGFTVGGSYYREDMNDNEADAWEVAGSYGQGPWAASIGYFTSDTDYDASKRQVVQASFSYNLGPGVDWKSSIANAQFTNNAGNENDGWAVITGFKLGF